MAKFAYNNAKNTSFSYILFKFNCGYYFQMLYKKNIDFYFKSKSIKKLLVELRELIIVCQKNLYYTLKLLK